MRGTLHTIPSDDARWVLRLLAPRIIAGTGRRYQQLGLADDLRQRSDRLLRRLLATHGPLTRASLTEHLTTRGVPPEGQAPFHLIRTPPPRPRTSPPGPDCPSPGRTGPGETWRSPA
jgi:hypothetical protein